MNRLAVRNCHWVRLSKVYKLLILTVLFLVSARIYFNVAEQKDLKIASRRLTKHQWILVEEGPASGFDKKAGAVNKRKVLALTPLDGCLYSFKPDGEFEVFKMSRVKSNSEKAKIWVISDGWWALENGEIKLLFSEGNGVNYRVVQLVDNCLILEDEMQGGSESGDRVLLKFGSSGSSAFIK
jgi:hypothetical protein